MADDFEQGAQQDQGGSTGIPPYIPFATFINFLTQLKQDGLPPQIDKSVLSKFSGGTQGQLKVALRNMGLMKDDKPTDDLEQLVSALDTPQFEPLLLELLKRTYPYIFALDLMTATPTMFADAFKVTGAKEDVSRKCRSFFLHAAKRAGVPLGNRILTGSVPRGASNGPKRRTKKKEQPTNEEIDQTQNKQQKLEGQTPLVEKLLDKFPQLDPAWPDDVKAQWFKGFQQLMNASKLK